MVMSYGPYGNGTRDRTMTDKELEALFLRQALYLPKKLLLTFRSEHSRYTLCLKLTGLMETAYFKSPRA